MNRPLLRVVTAAWPSPSDPTRARFLEDLHRALSTRFESEILAPRIDRTDPIAERRHDLSVHRFATPLRGRTVRSAGLGPVGAVRYVLSALGASRSVWEGSRSRGGAVLGHWVVPTGWVAARLARRLGAPLILYAHGSDVNRYGLRGFGRRMMREALRHSSLVFTASEPLAARLRTLVPNGVPVEVIPIGVSEDFIAEPPPSPPPPLRLLFVGDLLRAKGVEEIERAVTSMQARDLPVTLEWVGAPGDLGRAPRVGEVLGRLDPADVARAMSRAHLLLLPSQAEGTPVVLQEAMAMRLPWAATPVGGVPDLAALDRSSTLLPEPHDRDGVVGAIVATCERALSSAMEPENSTSHSARELAPTFDPESLRSRVRAELVADRIDALLLGGAPR